MNTSLLSPPRARPGDHLRWGGLIPGADALALASVAREHPGTVVILSVPRIIEGKEICDDPHHACR